MIRALAVLLLALVALPSQAQTYFYTGGGNATAYTDGSTSDGYSPHENAYGARFTATAVNVVSLSAYGSITGGGSLTLKIALYTTSNTLVAGASCSVTVSSASNVWNDCSNFAAVALSATDYYCVMSASTTNWIMGYDTAATGGVSPGLAYASFPTSTLSDPFEENEPNSAFGCRVLQDSGGGGSAIVPLILQQSAANDDEYESRLVANSR